MADKQESEVEKLILGDVQANQEALNSSQSVVMTLEDIPEIDPSLIMEHTMQFMAEQIEKIDQPIFKMLNNEASMIEFRDYLGAVYEPIILK